MNLLELILSIVMAADCFVENVTKTTNKEYKRMYDIVELAHTDLCS